MNWMGGTRKRILKASSNVHMQQKAGFERFRMKQQSESQLAEKRADLMNDLQWNLRHEFPVTSKNCSRQGVEINSRGCLTNRSGKKSMRKKEMPNTSQSLLDSRVHKTQSKSSFVDAGIHEWQIRQTKSPGLAMPLESAGSRSKSLSRCRRDVRSSNDEGRRLGIEAAHETRRRRHHSREKKNQGRQSDIRDYEDRLCGSERAHETRRNHSKEKAQSRQPRVTPGRSPTSRERSTVIENEWRRLAGNGLGLCGSVGAAYCSKKRAVESSAREEARQESHPSKRPTIASVQRSQLHSGQENSHADRAKTEQKVLDKVQVKQHLSYRSPTPKRNVWSNSDIDIAESEQKLVEKAPLKESSSYRSPSSMRNFCSTHIGLAESEQLLARLKENPSSRGPSPTRNVSALSHVDAADSEDTPVEKMPSNETPSSPRPSPNDNFCLGNSGNTDSLHDRDGVTLERSESTIAPPPHARSTGSRLPEYRSRKKVEFGLKEAWSWARSKCGRGNLLTSKVLVPLNSMGEDIPSTQVDESSQENECGNAVSMHETPTEQDEQGSHRMLDSEADAPAAKPPSSAAQQVDASKRREDEVSRETSDSALRALRASRGSTLSRKERRRLCGVFLHG